MCCMYFRWEVFQKGERAFDMKQHIKAKKKKTVKTEAAVLLFIKKVKLNFRTRLFLHSFLHNSSTLNITSLC